MLVGLRPRPYLRRERAETLRCWVRLSVLASDAPGETAAHGGAAGSSHNDAPEAEAPRSDQGRHVRVCLSASRARASTVSPSSPADQMEIAARIAGPVRNSRCTSSRT